MITLNVHSNLYVELREFSISQCIEKYYTIVNIYLLINEKKHECHLNERPLYLLNGRSLYSISAYGTYTSIHLAVMNIFEHMDSIYYYIGHNAYNINGNYIDSRYSTLRIDIKSNLSKTALANTVDALKVIFGRCSTSTSVYDGLCIIYVNIANKELRIAMCNDFVTLYNFVMFLLTIYRLRELKG